MGGAPLDTTRYTINMLAMPPLGTQCSGKRAVAIIKSTGSMRRKIARLSPEDRDLEEHAIVFVTKRCNADTSDDGKTLLDTTEFPRIGAFLCADCGDDVALSSTSSNLPWTKRMPKLLFACTHRQTTLDLGRIYLAYLPICLPQWHAFRRRPPRLG